jgi:hypothetical protein
MIAQARRKAEAAGLRGQFYVADAVNPPSELAGSADLVYTGKGALPWVLDIDPWAGSVRRLLRERGQVFVFEGHPLNALWDRDAAELKLRESASYFASAPQEQHGFPASVVRRAVGESGPKLLERFWRPGEVIDALVRQGLTLVHYREYPTEFWDQFPGWPATLKARLPQSYSILARA